MWGSLYEKINVKLQLIYKVIIVWLCLIWCGGRAADQPLYRHGCITAAALLHSSHRLAGLYTPLQRRIGLRLTMAAHAATDTAQLQPPRLIIALLQIPSVQCHHTYSMPHTAWIPIIRHGGWLLRQYWHGMYHDHVDAMKYSCSPENSVALCTTVWQNAALSTTVWRQFTR